jgi:hypothetical protein
MNPPTQQPTVGDLQITLTRAGHTCTLAGAELAKLIDSPAIVIRLTAVLYARSVFGSGKKGTTGIDGATRQDETNERNGMEVSSENRSFRDRGSKGEGMRPEFERMASYLADRLDDGKSRAFYRLVAEHVPSEVVRDSLTRALDVPAANVRRSRAAYFTSLVRPHLQGRLPNS